MMTPMARDQLTQAIAEGNRLFREIRGYLEPFRKGTLNDIAKERINSLGKEIFLFEEQLFSKAYGNDLLILTPMVKTLSTLARSMMLGKGLGAIMFSLSVAFLPVGEEGKGTKLLGPALEKYAKGLSELFISVFFPKAEKSHRMFFENLALLYLGASFSLGVLAVGVEKEEILREASDEIKQRVELTKEIAVVYSALLLQFLLQQRSVETCFKRADIKKPYGMELQKKPEEIISLVLEFAFLTCFIQGLAVTSRKKAGFLFKELLGSLKERVEVFEKFVAETKEGKSFFASGVTEMKFSLEEEDIDLFIEALNGFVSSFGIDEIAFYKDLEDLQKLVGTLSFIISPDELKKVGSEHTGTVQV